MTNPGWSGLRERPYPGREEVRQIAVRAERLDDALLGEYRPSFIKIDVEGAEREVLAGAIETISRHRPLIVFEHGRGSANYYGTAPGDVFALLCGEAQLRIFDLEGGGPYSAAQFAETYEAARNVNFLARA
jgi:hypothetical protein